MDGRSYAALARLLDDRYRRLHHVIFITLVFFFWLLFRVNHLAEPAEWLRLGLFSFTYIVIAYLNIYVLFPRLLLNGKIGRYVAISVLTFATSYFAQSFIYFKSWEKWREELTPSIHLAADMMINAITYYMFIGIGLSVKMVKRWLKSEIRISTLEQENLKARLSQLKGQVSPHFLFNTFNNLYVLTKTDPRVAAEMILGFSDLMRYQLDESGQEMVMVSKEVAYLENFLKLEQLRKDRLDLQFRYDPAAIEGLEVQPLLFVTLVENAVKHGSQKMDDAYIHVDLYREGSRLGMRVKNSCPDLDGIGYPPEGYPRIGIANLKKRLEIAYPGRHRLVLGRGPGVYDATLELQLS